jgi:hypothetical protein
MEQMTFIGGVMAMVIGAALFGLGAYGWQPVTARASAWLERPAALAGALGWLVRFAAGASPTPRARAAAPAIDVTPQGRMPAAPPAPVQRASARPVPRGEKRTAGRTARRRRSGGAGRARATKRASAP